VRACGWRVARMLSVPWGLAEGQSKGSGSLGARSGTIATRHPQADPGHDPEPLENRTQKTNRLEGHGTTGML